MEALGDIPVKVTDEVGKGDIADILAIELKKARAEDLKLQQEHVDIAVKVMDPIDEVKADIAGVGLSDILALEELKQARRDELELKQARLKDFELKQGARLEELEGEGVVAGVKDAAAVQDKKKELHTDEVGKGGIADILALELKKARAEDLKLQQEHVDIAVKVMDPIDEVKADIAGVGLSDILALEELKQARRDELELKQARLRDFELKQGGRLEELEGEGVVAGVKDAAAVQDKKKGKRGGFSSWF